MSGACVRVIAACLLLASCVPCGAHAADELVDVGACKVDITPQHPVILAGYGGRQGEFDGVDTPLWARALAIGSEKPVAIVVVDNCGVPGHMTAELAKRLESVGITRERLVVAATHTHNAPSLPGYAPIVWAGRTTADQDQRAAKYASFLIDRMEIAIVTALNNREPMRLEWAQGRATFGGNRRVIRNGTWAGFGFQRSGPVDHSLPVLAARDERGDVRAVWANYACHCTTVGSANRLNGDWAGFANAAMEEQFPKAISLMSIGCGADVGPQPSGNSDIARQHGQSIAAEVARLLDEKTTPISVAPRVRATRVKLPLEEPQSREHWEEQLKAGSFHAQLAKAMLAKLDDAGSIPDEVDYPLSVWRFGDELAIVFLAGEVVVDYSVRLKRELDWSRLWITAWANDMPGYIPSRRLLLEGGYEVDFSQVYYGQPGLYALEVEDTLVAAVSELVGDDFIAASDQEPAPFHALPSGEAEAFRKLAASAADPATEDEAAFFNKIREYATKAVAGVDEVVRNDGEQTDWYDYAGDFTSRLFIRQQAKGAELRWTCDANMPQRADLVICFAGGIGWESEPKTSGFVLSVNDLHPVRFDVAREPSVWQSEDGQVELSYLPTWTSNVDSAGFFFLRLRDFKADGMKVSVQSLGEGSKRWFAIDTNQDIARRLTKLRAAFAGPDRQP